MNRRFWIGAALAAGGTLLLAASAGATPWRGPLDAGYDDIYKSRCPVIPVEYLRALAAKESDTNPRETKGAAWGLLQVVEVVREDYNKAHGTSYTRQDLLDPGVNVTIVCDLLGQIVMELERYPPGRFDWSDMRQVRLLTLGWNAGWSRSQGVSGVIGYLVQQGYSAEQITIDSVASAASRLSWASKYVSDSTKVAWCKGVVALYQQELRRTSA